MSDLVATFVGSEGASTSAEFVDLYYGLAATVRVGTVTEGDSASVENRGTKYNAILDFTLPRGPEGPQGIPGEKGDPGPTGKAFEYSDFTEEQLAALVGPPGEKGDPGPKGDPFTYEDFTPEQLAALQGPPGTPGTIGPAGTSAYASAQAGGYTGTEEQFYTDLADMGNAAAVLSAM